MVLQRVGWALLALTLGGALVGVVLAVTVDHVTLTPGTLMLGLACLGGMFMAVDRARGRHGNGQ